ncbi:hypothetical protein KIN20_025445 [Parelaphostrongylus tenuis]|uniref:Uncharacterized protein n=1 Tax=Parelaphostrongylus tenuis TaxID=148309 RepID=A0AAD5MVA9_PARTN|nr:hypothetical protein KIN20_025445 [Parelaphostrongylus tenuis]
MDQYSGHGALARRTTAIDSRHSRIDAGGKLFEMQEAENRTQLERLLLLLGPGYTHKLIISTGLISGSRRV